LNLILHSTSKLPVKNLFACNVLSMKRMFIR
jgi:hypothetical protein